MCFSFGQEILIHLRTTGKSAFFIFYFESYVIGLLSNHKFV